MKNLDEIKFKEGQRSHAGMSVPENFFQDFHSRLMTEIANRQEIVVQDKKIGDIGESRPMIGNRRYRWISVAACIILVVGIGFFAMNLDQETNPNTNVQTGGPEFASVTAEAAEEEADTYDMLYASMSDMELYDFYCENF